MIKQISFLAIIAVQLVSCTSSTSENKVDPTTLGSVDSLKNTNDLVEPGIEKGSLKFRNTFDKENVFDWVINYNFYQCETCELLPYQKKVNSLITGFFSEENKEGKLDQSFFKQVFKAMEKDQKEMNMDTEYPMPFELEGEVEIEELNDRAQLYLQQYVFLGGAHGSTTVEYFQVDKETGKKLVLKDFIANKSKLDRLAERYFRQQNEIPMEGTLIENGFDSEFSCNDNFYFKGDSLYFFYNQYEIACYAMGSFEFGIPVRDLKGLLTRKP